MESELVFVAVVLVNIAPIASQVSLKKRAR
jgi:hypothetical protein